MIRTRRARDTFFTEEKDRTRNIATYAGDCLARSSISANTAFRSINQTHKSVYQIEKDGETNNEKSEESRGKIAETS